MFTKLAKLSLNIQQDNCGIKACIQCPFCGNIVTIRPEKSGTWKISNFSAHVKAKHSTADHITSTKPGNNSERKPNKRLRLDTSANVTPHQFDQDVVTPSCSRTIKNSFATAELTIENIDEYPCEYLEAWSKCGEKPEPDDLNTDVKLNDGEELENDEIDVSNEEVDANAELDADKQIESDPVSSAGEELESDEELVSNENLEADNEVKSAEDQMVEQNQKADDDAGEEVESDEDAERSSGGELSFEEDQQDRKSDEDDPLN